jgi:hypothetical protein
MTPAARAKALRVAIRYLKAEVLVVLKHQGSILPAPSAQPMNISLESVIDERLGFIIWFAVPQASTIERKPGEMRLTFNGAQAVAEYGPGFGRPAKESYRRPQSHSPRSNQCRWGECVPV